MSVTYCFLGLNADHYIATNTFRRWSFTVCSRQLPNSLLKKRCTWILKLKTDCSIAQKVWSKILFVRGVGSPKHIHLNGWHADCESARQRFFNTLGTQTLNLLAMLNSNLKSNWKYILYWTFQLSIKIKINIALCPLWATKTTSHFSWSISHHLKTRASQTKFKKIFLGF